MYQIRTFLFKVTIIWLLLTLMPKAIIKANEDFRFLTELILNQPHFPPSLLISEKVLFLKLTMY